MSAFSPLPSTPPQPVPPPSPTSTLPLDFVLVWGEREKRRETSMCGCLLWGPYWGPGLQPRPVPWLGIELVTLWFTGPHSIYWATPARAQNKNVLKRKKCPRENIAPGNMYENVQNHSICKSKKLKTPKCLTTGEWKNTLCSFPTMEYYIVVKVHEPKVHISTWMDLKNR